MKKMSLVILIILSGVLMTACNLETTNNTNEESTKVKQTENTASKENNEFKKKEDSKKNNYMDALRKCTVMEAADIYTTGIGKKSDNVFNDAKVTCESFYEQWGEKDFFEAVNEDWKNRKDEIIEDKPLSHYLDILGW